MKLIIATLLVLAMPLHARVGETVEELKKRFKAAPVEQPLAGGITALTFTREKESTLTASIVNGTVLNETYTNVTRAQADLVINDHGAGWMVSFDTAGVTQWKGPKGLSATFHNGTLVVTDGRFEIIQRQLQNRGQ